MWLFSFSGIIDCVDGTDELSCPSMGNNSIKNTFHCPEEQFKCDTNKCIIKSYRCDDKLDCLDGMDEFNCTTAEFKDCTAQDETYCSPLGKCLKNVWCNGIVDCPNGIDEIDCFNLTITEIDSTKCVYPNRTCNDKLTSELICLDISRFCDNRIDCADGFDENEMCQEDLCFFSECKGLCHNIPFNPGYVCYCEDGLSLAIDKVSCTDRHPCEQWGVCSQQCTPLHHHNREDGYKCSCVTNYELDLHDNFTCKSVDPAPPIVIYSNRHEIRSINIRTESSNLMIAGLNNTISLNFFYGMDGQVSIFFTDVMNDKIYKGQLIQNTITNIETVVENGLTSVEGLAVDWIGRNLYWTESNLKQIEVATINGSFRKSIISDLSNPRAIALDSLESTMFWTDWNAEQPRIESASMDGYDRRIVTLIVAGSWPNGIALDLIQKRIYWIDAKTNTISTIRYDGNDERHILIGGEYLYHPFAIDLFENYVYWSDWRSNSLARANKWNGTKVKLMAKTFTQPFDVKIIHPSKQPKMKRNQLLYNDCKCSHLCLLSNNPKGYRCGCPQTMKLDDDDENNCVLNEVYLMLSKQGEIRGIDLEQLNRTNLPPITMPKVLSPIQLTFKSDTKHIYWADSELNDVKRFSMLTNRIETVIDEVIQQPRFMALDWISNNLFIISSHQRKNEDDYNEDEDGDVEFVDDANGGDGEFDIFNDLVRKKEKSKWSTGRNLTFTLYICSLDGEYITEATPKRYFTEPQSFTIDPCDGYLYWSEYTKLSTIKEKFDSNSNKTDDHRHRFTPRTYLIRSSMDGSDEQVLIDSTMDPNIDRITSLQIDFYSNRTLLYWINLGSFTIQYLNLSRIGTKIKPVTIWHSTNLEPIHLTIYQSRLYVAFHYDTSIRSIDKYDGSDEKPIYNGTDDLLTIQLYDKNIQQHHEIVRKEAQCYKDKGGCEHLCIPFNMGVGRKCLCTIGFQPNSTDETKCNGPKQLILYSWNLGIRALALKPENSTLNEVNLTTQFADLKMKKRTILPSLLPPMSKILMASSLDYDSDDEILFWSDTDYGTISSIRRDTSHYIQLINGVERLVDIAYDWNSKNLYWLDEKYSLLEVIAVYRRNSRMVLISSDLIKPTSIAVHPGLGILFWSDIGHPNKVHIERTHLDGTNRSIIFEQDKSQHTINDLAIDLQNDWLYFSDSSSHCIWRIDFNGKKSMIVIGRVKSPISLAVHDRWIYWVDTHLFNGAIFRIDQYWFDETKEPLNLTSNQTHVTLVEADITDSIKDLIIYDHDHRPLYDHNKCRVDNGGCDDFCFHVGPDQPHRCSCSYGYVSPNDHRSCLEYDIFLMYSQNAKIGSIRISFEQYKDHTLNAPYPPITYPDSMGSMNALTYDYGRRRIIFSDTKIGSINWSHFNGSDHQPILLRQGSIDGLVYDQREQVLYWTSNSNSSIFKLDLSFSINERQWSINFPNENAVRVQKMIQLSVDDRLRAIAIDSCRSQLYWTNWKRSRPSIQRSLAISSSQVETIITRNIIMPNSIVIDSPNLYWTDLQLNKIERCDLDGLHCVILMMSTNIHRPFDIAVYGEHLYWTDWMENGIFRCNRNTGSDVTVLKRNIIRPIGLVAVAPPTIDECNGVEPTETRPNPCSIMNGGCEDICNILNNVTLQFDTAICSCFEGRELDDDGRRCTFIGSNCSETNGLFECTKSGKCIPFEFTCNGIANCLDGTDEDERWCSTRKCPATYHHCGNTNRCIPKTMLCDGVVHCSDGSDEKECDCERKGKFKCLNEICIDDQLRCNLQPDCSDASDEFECPNRLDCSRYEQAKANTMINCAHTTACIKPQWICDGFVSFSSMLSYYIKPFFLLFNCRMIVGTIQMN